MTSLKLGVLQVLDVVASPSSVPDGQPGHQTRTPVKDLSPTTSTRYSFLDNPMLLSPESTHDSPRSRRLKAFHGLRSPACPAAASWNPHGLTSALQTRQQREFKWGNCPRCGGAMSPYIYQGGSQLGGFRVCILSMLAGLRWFTGFRAVLLACTCPARLALFVFLRRAGHAVLQCNAWWRRTPGGQRKCWGSVPFAMSRFADAPRWFRDAYQDHALP